jgi:hypothetical protein
MGSRGSISMAFEPVLSQTVALRSGPFLARLVAAAHLTIIGE